jgi:hypothetical protein
MLVGCVRRNRSKIAMFMLTSAGRMGAMIYLIPQSRSSLAARSSTRRHRSSRLLAKHFGGIYLARRE